MARERWNIEQVAEYLEIAPGSVHRQLRRWGVPAVGREPGRGGKSLFEAAQVRSAAAKRPGRGARTDLRPTRSRRRTEP